MDKELCNQIKEVLEGNELFLTEEEVNTVLQISYRHKTDREHVGIRRERCVNNDREMAFHKHWLEENRINFGLNSGHGILHGLFVGHNIELTKRDRMIVATAIQWLGSNCGFGFLEETLKDCGYSIRPIPFKGEEDKCKTIHRKK